MINGNPRIKKNDFIIFEINKDDVLLDESKWYNGWVSVKVRKFKLQAS